VRSVGDVEDERRAWEDRGFFIRRGLIAASVTKAIEAEVIAQIRADPPELRPDRRPYFAGENYLIHPEKVPSSLADQPEDRVSKVFNCHVGGATRQAAEDDAIVDRVAAILGDDLDCFQSQFIFKNPGVVGQPWHQDSYYFVFDKQPQVGVWLALTKATLENGCLWVLPGSHRGAIRMHVPDRRPEANQGYLEIVDADFSRKEPVLMEPGDVLFFHSFLMHMSTDNRARTRRSAMVYHYGRAGTKIRAGIASGAVAALGMVNRWVPVRRRVDA
jgi:ectoine hydroxylase-related dioxygenase (phytanoyl-CoA dioxygenase family)